jgi:hypothetical protein
MLARRFVAIVVMVGVLGADSSTVQGGGQAVLMSASSPVAQSKSADTMSPEEKMRRRFPQAVKVGDLIGLPVLDDHDRTLGRVKSVVRTATGKIELIVPYGGFFGWRQRLVAVPIEVVAIAGRQLAALDMPRAAFEAAPAWSDPQSQPIGPSEVIRVALYRR